MTQPAGTPADDILLVLDESLPVIRAALVHYYGYEPSEAEAFNDTLAVWFHRVIRRAGNRVLSARELREQLLFVACKYARAFRLAKARTGTLHSPILDKFAHHEVRFSIWRYVCP